MKYNPTKVFGLSDESSVINVMEKRHCFVVADSAPFPYQLKQWV
jgi:hypothetical protein